MKILRASEMGMCFGVRDALAAARAVDRPEEVTIHGELVHNEAVTVELRERGFRLSAEADRAATPRTPRVLITAHGVSDRERARLEDLGLGLIDTTCPLVRFAHERAQALARAGDFVVVIGRRGHVEVEGLVGDLEQFAIVESETDVRDFSSERIGVVAQTTTRPEVARRLLAAIEQANPRSRVRFADTICGPTRNRQEAMAALVAEVEAVVVVGGKRSNNTLELVRFAALAGRPVVHVEGPGEIDPGWVASHAVIGLSAGTSTLPETVDAVERELLLISGRADAAA